jgi:hypothetical protein
VKQVDRKRIIALVGLVGGILALVGIFTPWITASGWGMSEGWSAWDSITEAKMMERETYCVLAFVGAILGLLGALSAMAAPRTKALWAILGIGAILAIAGAAWGFSDFFGGEPGTYMGVTISYGYGLYLTLVGGILALLGALGGSILALTGALGSKE